MAALSADNQNALVNTTFPNVNNPANVQSITVGSAIIMEEYGIENGGSLG